LLSTDWAVRLEPAVWTWKRHSMERGSGRPNRSRMIVAHIRGRPELGDLLEQLDQAAKKKQSGRRSRRRRAAATAAST
jgi:transcription elongation GreA/GreB family factor